MIVLSKWNVYIEFIKKFSYFEIWFDGIKVFNWDLQKERKFTVYVILSRLLNTTNYMNIALCTTE